MSQANLRDDHKYAYIATATTTQVDTGNGRLVRIVVGNDLAGAVSIIDNTSGSTVNIGLLGTGTLADSYEFGVTYTTGLRIITAGADSITVVYEPNQG